MSDVKNIIHVDVICNACHMRNKVVVCIERPTRNLTIACGHCGSILQSVKKLSQEEKLAIETAVIDYLKGE